MKSSADSARRGPALAERSGCPSHGPHDQGRRWLHNIQLAVDVKHKLIAEQEFCNQLLDMGLLTPTVEAAMDRLGVDRIETVADQGYFKIEDIEACETAGITAYVPKPIRGPAVAQGFFSKEDFRYDPDKDIYPCLADQVLSPRHFSKSRDNVKIDYVNRNACKACNLCERCTRSFRRVSYLENESVLDRMAALAYNIKSAITRLSGFLSQRVYMPIVPKTLHFFVSTA
ncbi:hypothetical protein DSM25558_3167 [Agrobacterium sp. DSM 25558]|uniref:hypothetical protein n=1 Tax=Agrobacterium sp. DSM 25558 TaxID=1907665 RepID=UPI00097242D1|nr:hypothetical protein [Agrobacterium sp. DSM 25558]SCX22536.1 hypothetical protein DSM25558_3167 [Agrobacterium sp. DSM 25558]